MGWRIFLASPTGGKGKLAEMGCQLGSGGKLRKTAAILSEIFVGLFQAKRPNNP